MIEPSQIATLRKRIGISQSELARRSGVSQSLIAKIEAGLLDPSYSKLKAISSALEKSNTYTGRCASEIMNREVIIVEASDKVSKAIEAMSHFGVSQLPVFAGEALVGTVSESSILDFVVRKGSGADSMQTPVDRVMSEPMPQVSPETGVDALVTLLKHFPAVLVSNKGEIRGIVTKSDLLSRPKISTGANATTQELEKQPQLV